MKVRYYLLIAVLSYLLFVLTMVPAQPVIALINANSPAQIAGVSGSLWNGRAQSITIENVQLSNTRWEVNVLSLLIGRASIDIISNFEGNPVSAVVGASVTGNISVDQLKARASAETVTRLANIPMAQLAGTIDVDIIHADWSQGELPVAEGKLYWNDASVTVAETASLGDITIEVTPKDDTLDALIKNSGGDISITGSAILKQEAEYETDMRFTPTASASRNIRQSLGLFAQSQPDGSFRLQNSGSLKKLGVL